MARRVRSSPRATFRVRLACPSLVLELKRVADGEVLRTDEVSWEQGIGSWTWRLVEPGSYRLLLRSARDERAVELDEFLVVAGRANVLDPIALSSVLQVIELRVEDAMGAAVAEGMVLVRSPGAKTPTASFAIRAGSAAILTTAVPIDALVAVPGQRPKEILGLLEDAVVRLDPRLELRLQLVGALANHPQVDKLHGSLEARDPEPALRMQVDLPEYQGRLGSLIERGHGLLEFDHNASATVTVPSPGRYEITLSFYGGISSGGESSTRPVRQIIEVADVAGEQRFEIRDPANLAELQRAVIR